MFGYIFPISAADLQRFSNVRLVNYPENDGDSFHVNTAGKSLHVRLYYVDCPEISAKSKYDAQRIREQTRYFGLPNAMRTIHFGNEAKYFVARILSQPFTVHTSFAIALGRSSRGRVYGFITTGDGDDLASLLVKYGFARTYGVGRETPDGISRSEMTQRLRDLETAAMLKRSGIWSESDPDRIAELRAEQRREDQKLQELQRQVKKADSPHRLLDLNTASKEDLESIHGIGPKLASRIIAGRPYKTINDLLKVKGIGKKKLKQFRSYFVVGKE